MNIDPHNKKRYHAEINIVIYAKNKVEAAELLRQRAYRVVYPNVRVASTYLVKETHVKL